MVLDNKFKKNIDKYSEKISTIKSFVEAVRQMPGMYIGPIGDAGFLNMIREIFQNSIDQLIDPNSPCNNVYIEYNMMDLSVTVRDNGLGIPFNDMKRVFTEQHTSKNYTKEIGEYSSGLHGVGAKVVNALSTIFICESYKYTGEAKRLELHEGIAISDPIDIPNPMYIQGTTIYFKPNTTVMGKIHLDGEVVLELVKRILALTNIGNTIDFKLIYANGEEYVERLVNNDGIITDLKNRVAKPFIKPVVISNDTGRMKLDMSFVYDTVTSGDEMESIVSFCNFCPTSGGTHVIGVLDGIYTFFLDYMNNIYLVNNTKIKVKQVDIKSGLNVFISAAHLKPIFTGQAKEILSNDDMKLFCKSTVIDGLNQWAINNTNDLDKLAKMFKEFAEIRIKSESEKIKVTNKFNASAITGMPLKYIKPEGKPSDKLELIICEGDSAGGSARDGRCKIRQGIFPIRGKIINAYTKTPNEVFNNVEIQAIVKILFNKSYQRNLPVEECKWDKIIIMADADPDGDHISKLVMQFFLLYLPQLIIAGKVYKAVPPLFGIRQKNKNIYFNEKENIIEYTQSIFSKSNHITTLDDKKISESNLKILLNTNADYVDEMDKVARYVHSELLELVLFGKIQGLSNKQIIKSIKDKYRFINAEDLHGTIGIYGTIGKNYNTLYINDGTINECINIINIINRNNGVFYYKLNGEVVSLYRLMYEFNKFRPNNIQRFKGLGEMNFNQLAESTLHPDSPQRTLIRYTIEDAKRDSDKIRSYEKEKSLLLKGMKFNRLTNLSGNGKEFHL